MGLKIAIIGCGMIGRAHIERSQNRGIDVLPWLVNDEWDEVQCIMPTQLL